MRAKERPHRDPSLKLMPSGVLVSLANPLLVHINPFDIAHCLARIARFNGACDGHVSVAQHCVHVSNLVPAPLAAWGLLHDAHEAYIGDQSSPLKALLGDAYRRVDTAWKATISARFGVQIVNVRYWDIVSMLSERRDNGPHGISDAEFCGSEPGAPIAFTLDPRQVLPLATEEAEERWLARFCELGIAA
jgi:uncharacterized protein